MLNFLAHPLIMTTEDCCYDTTKHLTPLPIPKVDCSLIRTSWCAGSMEYAFKKRFDACKYVSSCYSNDKEEMEILKESRGKSELKARASEVLLRRPTKKNSIFKYSNGRSNTFGLRKQDQRDKSVPSHAFGFGLSMKSGANAPMFSLKSNFILYDRISRLSIFYSTKIYNNPITKVKFGPMNHIEM